MTMNRTENLAWAVILGAVCGLATVWGLASLRQTDPVDPIEPVPVIEEDGNETDFNETHYGWHLYGEGDTLTISTERDSAILYRHNGWIDYTNPRLQAEMKGQKEGVLYCEPSDGGTNL